MYIYFILHILFLKKGLLLSLGRLACVANDLLTPRLAESYTVNTAVFTSFGFCILSICAAMFVVWMDKKFAGNQEE